MVVLPNNILYILLSINLQAFFQDLWCVIGYTTLNTYSVIIKMAVSSSSYCDK